MLARAIRSQPELNSLVLVLLSSHADRAREQDVRSAGIAACLSKPVRLGQLQECLGRLLRNLPVQHETLQYATVTPHAIRGRLLVAEDNAMNQKVAVRMLQKLGYYVEAVSDGAEALLRVEHGSFDVVLMDCQMPQMDGFESTREIRRQEGAQRHTVIIAMTAGVMAGDRERCLTAGMDDYVTKPVRPDELERVLQRHLKRTGRAAAATHGLGTEAEFISTLQNLEREIGIGVLYELIDDFIAEGGRLVEALKHQLTDNNIPQAARTLHTLRGCSATLGSRRLADLCGQLEHACSTGGLPSWALDRVTQAY